MPCGQFISCLATIVFNDILTFAKSLCVSLICCFSDLFLTLFSPPLSNVFLLLAIFCQLIQCSIVWPYGHGHMAYGPSLAPGRGADFVKICKTIDVYQKNQCLGLCRVYARDNSGLSMFTKRVDVY